MLCGLLLIGGQPIDFPKVWQKIEGKWSYVGQVKEKELAMIFKNKKIEVKKSSEAIYNVFVEYECRGKLSGLSVTEAETWIHLLSYNNKIEGGFIFNTGYLKDRIGELHKNKEVKVIMGGDNKLSQMVLVPIEKLFKD